MIQRIQTIYLLLTFVVIAVLPFVFPLWKLNNDQDYYFMQNQVYVVLLGLLTAITVMSILSYKKRQNQFVMNRLSMILNLILLGLFVFHSLNLSGEALVVSEKGIGMFLPIVAIVLLVLANKAIKKDEDLVKSVDRLR
ncbi:DUF4293 domain-containing protein [Flavobacterium crassostreae]|uniref:Transcription termination factor Rho n=1 Tax=Flavobacterium crassostreae TaxID=1763534 RepID=A0A1B9E2F6_9FLAO|nr:DUF4293 domain-containing protein [Flavobacterium crassostreae]OCB76120.1 transcription termination factor Rho [Flavobacterium crassostreae]